MDIGENIHCTCTFYIEERILIDYTGFFKDDGIEGQKNFSEEKSQQGYKFKYKNYISYKELMHAIKFCSLPKMEVTCYLSINLDFQNY